MQSENIMTIRVSDKGQICLPSVIRQKLNIEKGDDLVLFEIGGKILLEKSARVIEKMRDDFEDVLYFSEASLGEVWDNDEDDVWSSYLK